MKDSITEKVSSIFFEILDGSEERDYAGKSLKNDFKIDSLKMINFIVCLEEEYDFEFEDEDLLLTPETTLDDIIEKVKKRVRGDENGI